MLFLDEERTRKRSENRSRRKGERRKEEKGKEDRTKKIEKDMEEEGRRLTALLNYLVLVFQYVNMASGNERCNAFLNPPNNLKMLGPPYEGG